MYPVFELHLDEETPYTRSAALYRRDEHGQLALCDSHLIGPFDTHLEIAQWAWRALTRAMVVTS